ncbi:MAG: hypothetical protein BAJATHORv1_20134 [Candidatus Thorarchaeota archaeon]|nr:MAG: hypothetical protein BAJATHORv1_20134 [Candidatus Thorarchaeota archaeon]
MPMTCYFSNSRMKELFNELGIEVTKENKQAIDEKLHFWLSVDYPNCAATWKLIRKRLKEDGQGFKARLGEVLAEYTVDR